MIVSDDAQCDRRSLLIYCNKLNNRDRERDSECRRATACSQQYVLSEHVLKKRRDKSGQGNYPIQFDSCPHCNGELDSSRFSYCKKRTASLSSSRAQNLLPNCVTLANRMAYCKVENSYMIEMQIPNFCFVFIKAATNCTCYQLYCTNTRRR